MIEEARLEQTEGGLQPVTPGWFVVNVRDSAWIRNDAFGAGTVFEGRVEGKEAFFPEYGINIQVVWPGQPNCMYHWEQAQENILVLSGECVLLVEGQERLLNAWDFVHLPPGTAHVVVGAGDGPCAFLMTGTRKAEEEILYPADPVAQKHNAGVEADTPEPREAYANSPRTRSEPLPPDAGLPWQTGP